MKIIELNIPKEIAEEKGLSPISMSRLGNVVLIAGKNGSGKTRLLELIKEQTNNIPKESQIKQYKQELQRFEGGLDSYNKQLNTLDTQIKELETNGQEIPSTTQKEKESTINDINFCQQQIQAIEIALKWNVLKLDSYQEKYSLLNYVPKKLELDDSAEKNPAQISASATKSETFGVDHLAQTALSKVQSVCTRYSNATNPSLKTSFTEEEIKKATTDFDNLQEYFTTYLNTSVKINLDGLAEVFGFPIGSAKLSDGQKILVQYCIALFNQQAKLDSNVLLLDEPENHLHPEILLNTLDKIVEANKSGQIWIATHSINVLAHFYQKDIWFMESGEISFMGRKPEKVLSSLLGQEDEIEKLHQFISMPSIFATNQHAFESLKYPLSVMTGKSDPQSLQIFDLINKLKSSSKTLKMLDMGAGKGRLLQSMLELSEEPSANIIEWLDYYAYDKSRDDEVECTSLIKNIYTDNRDRYFNDEAKMLSKLEHESFDVIILVNVLHEISPLYWNDLFAKSSAITSLLGVKGKLIIVEDQVIPTGEKAYTEGFIVFDVPEFKALFKLKKYDFEETLGGRLKAHIFDKKDISEIDATSLKSALSSAFLHSKKEVENIRGKKTSYKNGMVHGFWVQQLANTFLIMDKLGIKIKH